jgi:hypothetical protein
MRRLHGFLSPALAFSSLTILPVALAGEISPVAVTFAQGYEVTFTKAYGAQEVPVLRSQIVDSLSQSLRSAGSRCSLALDVTVERAAPTHPTMQQQLDNPSLDPTLTVFRDGGASLSGHVLDSSGHVLSTVKYGQFAGDLRPISPARDPWSEARVAIEAFSSRLVSACIKQSASAHN